MGKKRIAKTGEEKKKVKIAGLKGGQRVMDMDTAEPAEKVVPSSSSPTPSSPSKPSLPPKPHLRGRAYRSARAKFDLVKRYSLAEAVKLVKEVSLSKFAGSVEAHLITYKKGLTGEVKLPFFKGKTKRVAIADDQVIEKIKAGKIDFDVLLAAPAFMSKLVPFAKILGPRGLMPNPKNGTLVENPAAAAEKFASDAVSFKTEKDFPLIHTVFGKVSQKEEELEANLKALIAAIKPANIKKLVIKPTMGPGIKVETKGGEK